MANSQANRSTSCQVLPRESICNKWDESRTNYFLTDLPREGDASCTRQNSKTGFLHLLCVIQGVNSLHKKKIQNRYVRKDRNRIAIYLVHCKSFDCTVGYMMHQVISEFVNLFVEKHFYLNNVNFFIQIKQGSMAQLVRAPGQ